MNFNLNVDFNRLELVKMSSSFEKKLWIELLYDIIVQYS